MKEILQMAFNRKEASRYLGISEKTLDKLLEAGRIKYQKVERTFIIPKLELDRFLTGEVAV